MSSSETWRREERKRRARDFGRLSLVDSLPLDTRMADSSKEALTAAQEQLKIGHPAEGENANLRFVPSSLLARSSRADLEPDSGVLLKLLAFTVAMVVLPVGSYFVSRDYYFGGTFVLTCWSREGS